jgi:hypothetical protein
VPLDLLPDMPAAAQVMWDQVDATDFHARVGLLAAEARPLSRACAAPALRRRRSVAGGSLGPAEGP